MTQSGQKRFYSRWQNLTEKAKLINECKVVSNFLASLTQTIKSATDSCFLDTKENQLKEKALIQLFKNMSSNVGDTFKRWRDVNAIEKLRERLTNKEKQSLLNVLNNLLHNSKRDKIAEVIRRFRTNRKIVDIQRNFLKKLLLSKAGLVVVAFKKIQSLPERKKDAKGYDNFMRFEKGLQEFWSNTMKRAYVPIKNELE